VSFPLRSFFFSCNDTSPPDISPLSLHDALPICAIPPVRIADDLGAVERGTQHGGVGDLAAQPATDATLDHGRHRIAAQRSGGDRSEEHTSELQSLTNLVCRLLLEKNKPTHHPTD